MLISVLQNEFMTQEPFEQFEQNTLSEVIQVSSTKTHLIGGIAETYKHIFCLSILFSCNM